MTKVAFSAGGDGGRRLPELPAAKRPVAGLEVSVIAAQL
jgi:hypothetical protein